LLLLLLFAKMLAFALTVASGGSGGVFAPSLFVGAMLGGSLAELFHQPPAAFVVVGMAAVFGGAARVPIATLLMVTEMTGGYHLLVPAALAVMLSYLVQVTLSASFTYKSLYEAQVPRRADSPAHHAEHLRVALSLLDKRQIPASDTVGHLNLLALLQSGISVDLSNDKRLTLEVLQSKSPWIGQSIHSGCLVGARNDRRIIAIVRQEQMLLPCPDTVVRAEDQLLMITSSRTKERLEEHRAALSP
jgi:CIC family chloride channel protein